MFISLFIRNILFENLLKTYKHMTIQYIDSNVTKPHIMIFDKNGIFCGNIFLIPFSIKC